MAARPCARLAAFMPTKCATNDLDIAGIERTFWQAHTPNRHGPWSLGGPYAPRVEMERPRGRYHTGASSPLSPSVFRAPKAADYKP